MPPRFTPDFQPTLLKNFDPIFLGYVYGAFTLYGVTFQSTSTSLKKIVNQVFLHHISPSFHKGIQFVLCRVRSTLLTASLLLSFPLPTKMFQFGRFPLLTEHPKIGSPIR
jgi:O-antigen/teichoic acid export membrane protein